MEKIDFIKEIQDAFNSKDMESVKALVETLIDYQNKSTQDIKDYTTALEVEKKRHKESSMDLIQQIQKRKLDMNNLSTASSFVMRLATANSKLDKMIKELLGNK